MYNYQSHICLCMCGNFTQVRFSEDVGEIYKVRLGFDDDSDTEENWLLDTVRQRLKDKAFKMFYLSTYVINRLIINGVNS